MPRVTSTEVKGILDGALLGIGPRTDIEPFISSAHVLVNALCADSGYSDTELKTIELWLSAHFTQIKYPPVQKEDVLRSSTTWLVKNGMNLAATVYGQQAMVLSYKGELATASRGTDQNNNARKPSLIWGGTKYKDDGCC